MATEQGDWADEQAEEIVSLILSRVITVLEINPINGFRPRTDTWRG